MRCKIQNKLKIKMQVIQAAILFRTFTNETTMTPTANPSIKAGARMMMPNAGGKVMVYDSIADWFVISRIVTFSPTGISWIVIDDPSICTLDESNGLAAHDRFVREFGSYIMTEAGELAGVPVKCTDTEVESMPVPSRQSTRTTVPFLVLNAEFTISPCAGMTSMDSSSPRSMEQGAPRH